MGNDGDYKIKQYLRNLEFIARHMETLRFTILELGSYRQDMTVLIKELEKIYDCEQIKDIGEHANHLHNEIMNLDCRIEMIFKELDKMKEHYNSKN